MEGKMWSKDWLRHGTGNHRHPQHQTPRPRRLGIIAYCVYVRLTPRSRSRVPPAKRKRHLALLVCQSRSNDLNVLQRPRWKRCGSPVPVFPPPFLSPHPFQPPFLIHPKSQLSSNQPKNRQSWHKIQIETQVENFDTLDECSKFMEGDLFKMNPIGTDFQPEELIKRLESGEDERKIKERAEIGARLSVPGVEMVWGVVRKWVGCREGEDEGRKEWIMIVVLLWLCWGKGIVTEGESEFSIGKEYVKVFAAGRTWTLDFIPSGTTVFIDLWNWNPAFNSNYPLTTRLRWKDYHHLCGSLFGGVGHQNKITSSPLIVLWLHFPFMPCLDTGANIQWQ